MKRPKPKFIKRLRIEEPPSSIRSVLIDIFKDGGAPIEEKNQQDLGVNNKISCVSDVKSRVLGHWLYVSSLWWCRVVKGKYQFARFVAMVHDDECDKIDGVWNERRHGFREPLVIVFCGDREGVVVGYSEFELWVRWFSDGVLGMQCPVRVFDNFRFKYAEDEQFYSRIIANIKR